MIEIYHNPRCRKSREALKLLESKGIEHQTILYLDQTLNTEELKALLEKLKINAEELVRKNESIWKEQFKAHALTEDDIVEAMVKHPKLIERPIVVNGNRAVIGRPAENILTII
ncbi:arsenate reductase (glutaredoxin) [Paucihalobacter ruber]|uniref:Arsenate reductase (Glutaredoxin) n=1 Tax=Paucihalobacter ruber TaxID=2567861 RepID=A0A506PH48_9FLAO|nr:arsenate reductase (glutaredoxin) [Paucihalobacter ruber]TPV32422.1 arsenate reductase (glutaredoxin) [Paucihalobacter ruber]